MTTYYTPEEVADILKVRKHTVWNWLREGTLKGTKINGKIWRITDKDLEAFINKEESEVSKKALPSAFSCKGENGAKII